MNIGMLWLDDDQKRTIEEKVTRAMQYYKQKYKKTPNLCFVSSNTLSEEIQVGKVAVRPAIHIQPQHFWIGLQKG